MPGKTAQTPVNLSALAGDEVEHFSEAVKELPEEIGAFVRRAHGRKLKTGEWNRVKLATEAEAKRIEGMARKYAEHHGLTFRINTKETKAGMLVYRVSDKVSKTTKPAQAN